MNSLTRRALAPLAMLATAALAAACGGVSASTAADSNGLTTVTVGLITEPGVAPLYLGQAKGIFKKHGINLKLTVASGGAAIMPAVVSGQTDIGFGNDVSLLVADSKNLPVKIVAPGGYGTGDPQKDYVELLTRSGGPITSVADLAGKTVAVNAVDNIVDTSVREAVRQAGGDPKAVKFTELPFPSMNAALANGQVDAIVQSEPFVSMAEQQGGISVVDAPFSAVKPSLLISSYFTSDELIKKDPKLVQEFTAAVEESESYASSHLDELRAIIPSFIKVPADLANKMTLPVWKQGVDRSSLEALSKLVVEDGLVTSAPNIDDLLQK